MIFRHNCFCLFLESLLSDQGRKALPQPRLGPDPHDERRILWGPRSYFERGLPNIFGTFSQSSNILYFKMLYKTNYTPYVSFFNLRCNFLLV